MSITYSQVSAILEQAATDGSPSHQGHGRFWTLPYPQFMAIDTIYSVRVIAEPGAHRGARSGLIQALRGEGRFTDDDLGRMPLGRPAVAPDDIQKIQDWIDADCPE